MKKLQVILLVALSSTLLLFGCGDEQKEQKQEIVKPVIEEVDEEPVADKPEENEEQPEPDEPEGRNTSIMCVPAIRRRKSAATTGLQWTGWKKQFYSSCRFRSATFLI